MGKLNYFGAIVMLTGSDWYTEPKSNRYQYASRFARENKVVFVQPDTIDGRCYLSDTEFENIVVLHVTKYYKEYQGRDIDNMLFHMKIVNPLFWVFNYNFVDYIESHKDDYILFHASEDYVSLVPSQIPVLKRVLSVANLVVAVSDMVMKNYESLGIKGYDKLLLKNGVDFRFWKLSTDEITEKILKSNVNKNIAYQGGCNSRLDYQLLDKLVESLQGCMFHFFGKSDNSFGYFYKRHKNVVYHGKLSTEELRNELRKMDVGIIPFVQTDAIYNSIPLKTYEYLASGLSVVSVPIEGIKNQKYIHFADSVESFKKKIETALKECSEADIIEKNAIAKQHDWENNFCIAFDYLKDKKSVYLPRKVNIMYDEKSMNVFTIKNYLSMFERYSRNAISYTNVTGGAVCKKHELDEYDSVIIFYSVRINVRGHMTPSYEQALKGYKGHKMLFIQDDYDNTEEARRFIKRTGIMTVFTVVPEQYIDWVYPEKRFKNVLFINVLTGYISEEMKKHAARPIAQRDLRIGYRGRDIGFWYGDLAREKLIIGQKMKQICESRNINVDIEWESDKRIYDDQWLNWLGSCRATLGTESGSNVFDDYGLLKAIAIKKLKKNPNYSYEKYHKRYLFGIDGKIKMNQVSPKMFEAISLKTALIMYEGDYSGILRAGVDYIPLKKDWSNIDEVLCILEDTQRLQRYVDKAYEDIINRDDLQYEWLISFIDERVKTNYFSTKKPMKIYFMLKELCLKCIRIILKLIRR